MLVLGIFLFLCSSSVNVVFAGAGDNSGDVSNPFTPKAYLIRYWNQKIQSEISKSNFLLSKVSPLDAVDSATYTKLAAQNSLSSRLHDFCSAAKLFCFPDLAGSLEKHDKDSSFAVYLNRNFTNYGTKGIGGANSFKNYSENNDVAVDSFRRYSRDSVGHEDQFASYASGTDTVDERFNTYDTAATGGSGDFSNYSTEVRNPNLRFTSYSDDAKARGQKFSTYTENTNAGEGQTFTSYGKHGHGSPNQYKNYGVGSNVVGSIFSNYGETASRANDTFTSYGIDANVPQNNFTNYGERGTGAADTFTTYGSHSNVPDNNFKNYGGDNATVDAFNSYGSDSNVVGSNFKNYGRGNATVDTFTSYGSDSNGPENDFKNYGEGNATADTFTSYGSDSNAIGSNFKNYGRGNAIVDTFTSYGSDGNVPENNFTNYGEGNAAILTFSNYRDQSNVGDDSFQSYAKNSNSASAKVKFNNYGESFNEGSTTFTGYGKADKGNSIDFKNYSRIPTFKEYAKSSITFSSYTNGSSAKRAQMAATASGSFVNRWVEPGKFFRESMLKKGAVMPMPDIRDKMPKRAFLPRTIISKLPFSSSKIVDLKKIFHAADNSSLESIMLDALRECERAPSAGETKRCVGSAEDMIDFATSVLGRNVAVRTTENINGSKKKIMIGSIKKINGGQVTKSVSCHQSLYPYLLYYCHSVPKVRVYEADILDPNSKEKMNHGVAICHLDTSAWSAGHGAFLALGSGPGRIEVCHWIFENDLTWTIAD